MELLPLSVGIGLVIGLLATEMFGVASGGLIVPGYLSLYLTQPGAILATVGVGLLTFIVVKAMSTFLIVYGRRRTALMILIGYIFGMLARQWGGFSAGDFAVIGFVIPGLIAIWMDRQGVVQTLASMTIVSISVRLILIVFVGTEMI